MSRPSCDYSSSYDEDGDYQDLDNEDPHQYVKGGYHPVKIGEVYNDNYRIENKLGWGSFSTVWLATDLERPDDSPFKYVAIKFHKSARRYTKSAIVEVNHLKMVRDMNVKGEENVVSLLDCFVHIGPNGKHICLVFEVLGKNILQLIIESEKRVKNPNDKSVIPLSDVKRYTRDVLKGLAFMHSCKIIHTDIKPENISLTLTEEIDIKKIINAREENCTLESLNIKKQQEKEKNRDFIKMTKSLKMKRRRSSSLSADSDSINEELHEMTQSIQAKRNFDVENEITGGISRKCSRAKIVDLGNSVLFSKVTSHEITTRQYRAPEVILGKRYSSAVDVWALACVVFEMVTGDFLFDPKESAKSNYTKDDDHLALMIELLGKIPRKFALSGNNSSYFFTRRAELRKIKEFDHWELKEVLEQKYNLDSDDSAELTSFLLPMLEYSPSKRVTAEEAINHPWLRTDCDDAVLS